MKCLTNFADKGLLTGYLENYSSVVVVAWDQTGHISYCNKAFLTLLQTESAPIGKSVGDFLVFPEESQKNSISDPEPVRMSARLKAERADYRCDATVYAFDQCSLAFCEKPIMLQSDFVAKMTELNQELANLTWELNQKNRLIEVANQAMTQEKKQLQESERRYRQLLEDANVIILTFNVAGIIVYMNEFGRFFFQFDTEELIGRSLFDTIVPKFDSSGKSSQAIFADEITKIASFQRYTGENLTRSGKYCWIDWTVRRLPSPSGEKEEYMAIGVDVTAQRRIRVEEKLSYTRRQRSEVFNDAIARQLSNEDFVILAKKIGVEVAEQFACIVLLADDLIVPRDFTDDSIEMEHLQNRLIDCLCNEKGRLAWQTPDGIGVLQPLIADGAPFSQKSAVLGAANTLERLKQSASALSFHCGVSHLAVKATTLAELYAQSLAAARYGPTLLGRRAVYHWQDLGAYQFVVRDLHSPMSTQFVKQQLGPILSLRSTNKQSDLLRTLEEIVTHDSVEMIGKRLNIVSKTVRYRKRNLEKLLGVSLDSLETLSSLSLALKIRSIIGTE